MIFSCVTLFLWNQLLNLSQFYFDFETKIKKMTLVNIIYNYLYHVQKEPKEKEWTNISWIVPIKNNTIFYDNYSKPNDRNQYPEKEIPYLFISLLNSNYFIRESRVNLNNIKRYLYFSKSVSFQSKFHFVYIQYYHPKLEKYFQISLDSKYYMIGNEILSSIFIARYFHYTYGMHFYHNDYHLDIIDENMNYFTINKNNFIFIHENGYKIKSFE